jgi:hypothetical protein
MFLLYNKYKTNLWLKIQTCFDNKSRHKVYNVTNFRLNKRASVNPAETRFNSATEKMFIFVNLIFLTNRLIQNPVLPLRMV